MFSFENVKKFAKNHLVITFLGCFLYGFILGIVHDLRYYGLIKK